MPAKKFDCLRSRVFPVWAEFGQVVPKRLMGPVRRNRLVALRIFAIIFALPLRIRRGPVAPVL
jgi:hypothetical protein